MEQLFGTHARWYVSNFGKDNVGSSLIKKVVVVIMCFAMATPLFYSMAGGGGQPGSSPGPDAVALEKSMRDRVRLLVSPTTDKDSVLLWSRCLADGLIAWFDETGCAKLSDAKERDTCLANADMDRAYDEIFQRCAASHAPKSWAGLSGGVTEDVEQFLRAQKTPAIRMKPLSICITNKAIAAMETEDCPPIALFQTDGCFATEIRSRVYSGALDACSEDTKAPTEPSPASP